MAEYSLYPSILPDSDADGKSQTRDEGVDEPELCGAVMTDDSKCDRLADECPYESHRS